MVFTPVERQEIGEGRVEQTNSQRPLPLGPAHRFSTCLNRWSIYNEMEAPNVYVCTYQVHIACTYISQPKTSNGGLLLPERKRKVRCPVLLAKPPPTRNPAVHVQRESQVVNASHSNTTTVASVPNQATQPSLATRERRNTKRHAVVDTRYHTPPAGQIFRAQVLHGKKTAR